MFKTKKGQTGGLITGLIFGIASLVIGVIIAFVIVSTLTNADLLTSDRTSVGVVNESGWINSTGYTLAGSSINKFVPGSISMTIVNNGSGGGIVIPAANYSISSLSVITNVSGDWTAGANFTYTYDLYNDGVDNVSSKIPTILLIAAIVLILGVLVLLVGAWQRMRIGSGGI